MSKTARRYNTGKPKYSLLSLKEFEPGVRVLEYGANKYTTEKESGRDNWKKGLPITEILDSMMRHISELQAGNFIDSESGLSHIGHIQANALFLGNPNNINDLKHDNSSG